ncbi:hypothetical protein TEA_012835 [Camellia sinensis var. sinensis]|uniref:Exocyst complex component Sec10 n=1 Tax=Camellia sinensis var. sinensis TaxID=542762 RepID=A0A4V3WQA2_CAMSN|nr:hypothetical protein TEA_012835 [Camellia sinensis var. sinensis]
MEKEREKRGNRGERGREERRKGRSRGEAEPRHRHRHRRSSQQTVASPSLDRLPSPADVAAPPSSACPGLCFSRSRVTVYDFRSFHAMMMKESGDGVNNDSYSKSLSVNSGPLVLDEDDFKGDFSFDALFGNLVNELLPSYHEEETDSLEGHGNIGANDVLSNGNLRIPPDAGKFAKLLSGPLFPEVDALLSLFQDSCRELIELHKKIDGRLSNLKKEVVVQDSKHRKTLTQLEKGVDGLFGSFARLDSRISSVGQTAAKIGDHLQSADAQRETASQTIELIKYLMEFNSSPGDLLEISPLFSDDSLVAEAASIAQKLRSFAEEDIGSQSIAAPSVAGNATASRGLEVAVANLQEYCNVIHAIKAFALPYMPRRDTNGGCKSTILQLYGNKFNRGTSAMQHYVATRPMFIDVEVMNADIRLVLGDEGSQPSPSNVARGLSSLYKEILGLTESLFTAQKDEYIEHEQASLRQLYKAKVEELHAENQQSSESSGTIGRSKGAAIASSQQQISVTVVTEFVHWNEEAISRCTLFSSQTEYMKSSADMLLDSSTPATLAANVKAVFTCLLDEVSQYTTKGLERARDSLTEAAALRERFVLGTSVSKRVAASAAEAAAAAGESSFRSFMVAVQRCASSVAIVQQHFANTISRLLLPVDGAHASSCEEMATAMSSAEGSACKGLQQCIETVMAEVERLLSAEQKAPDYRSPDDGIGPDHRATNACSRVVAYLSRVLEAAFTALEGLNKQAFLTELGNRLQKGLINHWQKFTFNPSGGLRLKRDITEYGEFVRRFNTPSVDEKFELLGIMANVFIVAPESLSSLFEGTPSIRKDAQRLITNSGLLSSERTTRVQNWHPDSVPCGRAPVDAEVGYAETLISFLILGFFRSLRFASAGKTFILPPPTHTHLTPIFICSIDRRRKAQRGSDLRIVMLFSKERFNKGLDDGSKGRFGEVRGDRSSGGEADGADERVVVTAGEARGPWMTLNLAVNRGNTAG